MAAHRMDVLRTSVGPKMVASSKKNVFKKCIMGVIRATFCKIKIVF